ncbi:MAG: beta-ketoacyl-ACP synthase II [Anaerolineae bacterium]|uniref:beta-ketoacyl-ACP synthase II n=1 Tax=Candidatus Amarolinea dominans TaxID=3140696 RepID=UPI001E0F3385|nr:beta-ketoacyl-ACP synthase II [Anaerolineae bacterium]MBK9091309.1 beta-ketoacyl-ACP synthase II [Anaerolineae bacterium]
MTRVFVTGMGALSALGNDVPTYWQNLLAGKSGAGPIIGFDASDLPVRIACEVKDFDASQFMDRKTARRTARSIQLAVAATRQALADAHFEVTPENSERVGVLLNTGGGGITEMEPGTIGLIEKGPRSVGPFLVPNVMSNAVACVVSIEFGVRGPVMTSTAACASGNYALIEGYNLIQRDEADVVIAGGSEAAMSRLTMAAFARMGPLSSRNDDPEHACRPFDKERDGFVCGEGAGVMILESEAHARARGAQLLAEVRGGRITGDGYHITAPEPSGNGAARAIRNAIKAAGLQPEDIDLIYAHGTGTTLNDAVETTAIKKALGQHAYSVAVTATKSMIGHTLGAAGALSAIGAVLSLHEGIIPPTMNYSVPDPECDLDYVPDVARQKTLHHALVNAFGFGGQNVVAVLSRVNDSEMTAPR